MSLPTVTCPHCQTLLRPSKPVPIGTSLRCPECKQGFTAPGRALRVPDVSPSPFPPPAFLIAATVSVLLGGAVIAGAIIFRNKSNKPEARAEDKPKNDDKDKAGN